MVTEMAAKNKKLTYDELYSLYRNYVVLMLKTFMYTAYDDSARILSYLMDYKLCDTLDGLYCAGPDKEKISSVLSAHHVNHIISEFGEITKMSTYEDNRYEMYLGLDKNIEPRVAKPAENTIPTVDTTVKPSTEPVVFTAPEWLCVGKRVIHKAFGRGVILTVTGKKFTIQFDSGENKGFIVPDSLRFFQRDDVL